MRITELSQEKKDGLYIASGGSHPKLAYDIANAMGTVIGGTEDNYLTVEELDSRPERELGGIKRKTFDNSESYVRYDRSVRDKEVIIVQSPLAIDGHSVNDWAWETAQMADAAYQGNASKIILFIPLLPYSRSDVNYGRESLSSQLFFKLIEVAGVNHIVTVDNHSKQSLAGFRGHVDHISARPLFVEALKSEIGNNNANYAVVSPDAGRYKTSEIYANQLGVKLVNVPKNRDENGKVIRANYIEGVGGKICIVTDDMIDTSGTIVSVAETLKNSGATAIIVAATHGIFSGPAIERLQNAPMIEKIYVTNTLPQEHNIDSLNTIRLKDGTIKEVDRFNVLSIAQLGGIALKEIIISRGSISQNYPGGNQH